MTREEELEHLKKRKQELKTIECNLRDIADWFEKNEISMESKVDFEDLEEAISEIQNTQYSIDDEIETLIDVMKDEDIGNITFPSESVEDVKP